ncbi:fatty acid desaturase [Sinimarinibacterium sp. NLF-5-8]|uniref:fatty acid desaturase family protein n=1 Tax=Sinimarinibacterium sp. NLF-5-8 TaxID=2698684 RepID=UPI00137BBDCB|nr:fatty acid desaturase [Sinimarinibacterium sp. NLF-5-8]QHS09320.1 fatty acid desaturase [Sinimarinibacterium sp. NLF-5-8]
MEQDLSVLNQQAIRTAREYVGQPAWPTVALVLAVLVGLAATFTLFASGQLPLLWATALYGALTFISYTPLHEAAHQNINGSNARLQWLNDLCGYLVAPWISVAYSTHKVEHFTHHRYTNQPEKDPDYVCKDMQKGLLAFVVYAIKFLWVQNTFLFREHWATAPARERAIYWAEISVMIGWRVGFLWLLPTLDSVIFLLAGYLSGAFFTAYWFAYRPHLPYEDSARYRNTNSMFMPRWMKPLEWFWLGQNLHSIHHLFPRVPFYRYHALHRRIEPIMRAHGTPMIGIFSRQPIPADADS